MKGKEKDKKTGFPDFLKYRGNSLSGKDKNSFERELQKDPFATEAEEGFSSIDQSQLNSDMTDLEKRLQSRTGKDKRFIWYRMAASVAVLMLIATVFYIVQNEKPQEISSASEKKEITFDIQKPEAIKDIAPAVALNQEPQLKEKSPSAEERKYVATGVGKMKSGDRVLADTVEMDASEMVTVAAEKEITEALQLDVKMPAAARSAVKSQELKPAGDSLVRDTLDPDLTSLDEVVVVGYGISKREETINENTTYTEAEPVTGRSNFNSYIEKNIVRPLPGTQKETVILNFTVMLNGEPANIKVVRSPGKPFSDEAIRLVKEGPKWKPATENGVNIEDEVRVRIVFK